MLTAKVRERLCSLQLFGARNGTGCLPFGIIAHLAESSVCFSKERIIEAASSFQMHTHLMLLAPIHAQGQLQDEGRGLLPRWNLLRPLGRPRLALHSFLPVTLIGTPVCQQYSVTVLTCQDLFLMNYMKKSFIICCHSSPQ